MGEVQKPYRSNLCLKKPKTALDALVDKHPVSPLLHNAVENTTKILEDYHLLVLQGRSLSSQYELMLSEWESEVKSEYKGMIKSTLEKDERLMDEETARIKKLRQHYAELSRVAKKGF